MKLFFSILLILFGILLLPVLFTLAKTLVTPKKASGFVPRHLPVREKQYAEKLSKMIQCETVSEAGLSQREKFLGFHKVLKDLFPLVHKNLEKTEIDGSLLFRWAGKSQDKPLVLMGHQDVVPAEGEWVHEPFSGDIADGKVWGRGTADTKCTVMAFFQAVEELLAEGYVPQQDVYLCSSCTEETGGPGASRTVAELARRGVHPFLVCDEGGAIAAEPLPGFAGYYAMVGILEKGSGNVTIKAKSNGGHASKPPQNSPIARLSAFVCDIEKHNPMKAKLEPQLVTMFSRLAPYAPFALRLLMGNLWLYRPLLELVGPSFSPTTAALMRTTIAFTQASGSQGANVLPQEATLTLNMRYMPHQDKNESLEILRKLAAKYDLEVEDAGGGTAFPPVDIRSEAYQLTEEAIREVFPGLPVIPYIMTGGTDAAVYQQICPTCVRFGPVILGSEQLESIHGLNENIETVALPGAVDFFKKIIGSLPA